MQYIYAAMWFVIGLILIGKLRKENKVFIFAGCIFLFMGVWWLLGAMQPALELFSGVYGWIFRAVMAAALIVTAYVYFKQKKKDRQDSGDQSNDGGNQK